jgi:DNA polymerase-3 subunit beta
MKFVVSSFELLSHLQAIGRAISTKSPYPVLECFLFELQETNLNITASDLEVTMTTSIEVEVIENGENVAMPSKMLLDALKNCPEQPLTFNISEEDLTVEITSERGNFKLVAQPGEDYPSIPEIEEDKSNKMQIAASILLAGINKTIFATAEDDLRPVMNGILIELAEENLTFVASDSHKLVRYRRNDIKNDIVASFILAKKPAFLLKSVLPKEVGDVTVEFDHRNAFFQLPNYKLVCRMVEGNYPAYSAVIPQDNPYKVTVDRVDFAGKIKLVAVFANQSSNLLKLQITENKMVVSAQDLDFSHFGQEELNCQYEGDELEIGFKAAFLADIVDNLSSTDIVVEMANSSRAALFSPFEKNEIDDELMLLMPMMIN